MAMLTSICGNRFMTAYLNDDWRVNPQLTMNAGVRWEYGAPVTETKNRLVNLDVAPGFTAIEPVVASNPKGPLTGQSYPTSLMRPDKNGFEPRIGLSWRPIPGSSMVVRAGYGLTTTPRFTRGSRSRWRSRLRSRTA